MRPVERRIFFPRFSPVSPVKEGEISYIGCDSRHVKTTARGSGETALEALSPNSAAGCIL